MAMASFLEKGLYLLWLDVHFCCYWLQMPAIMPFLTARDFSREIPVVMASFLGKGH